MTQKQNGHVIGKPATRGPRAKMGWVTLGRWEIGKRLRLRLRITGASDDYLALRLAQRLDHVYIMRQ